MTEKPFICNYGRSGLLSWRPSRPFARLLEMSSLFHAYSHAYCRATFLFVSHEVLYLMDPTVDPHAVYPSSTVTSDTDQRR